MNRPFVTVGLMFAGGATYSGSHFINVQSDMLLVRAKSQEDVATHRAKSEIDISTYHAKTDIDITTHRAKTRKWWFL